jgi:hypothetical protein
MRKLPAFVKVEGRPMGVPRLVDVLVLLQVFIEDARGDVLATRHNRVASASYAA